MSEIKCPKCGEIFQIDEAEYAGIVKQIRDKEFNEAVKNREEVCKKEFELEILKRETEKDEVINKLRKENELLLNEKDAAVKIAVLETEKQKQKEIEILKAEKQTVETAYKNDVEMLEQKRNLEVKSLEEEIARVKEFKARLSTKMVGESLEVYCHNEFDKIRTTAFPNAYFEKDNDAKSGSKGDFIFRDFAAGDDQPYISIMFEMKNENDETASKHKNEEFFKELDKDRTEKNCEYAVLVSMLEADNDFYNNGIVDVSYKYPKMYVIRPQFFIQIISLLTNAAKHSLEYRRELQLIKSQQVDFTNFEDNLEAFKKSFGDSFRKAGDRFQDAIEAIDKSIANLTKVRENLLKSESHLNAANNKLGDATIKKLTHNAPAVRDIIEQSRD